MIVLEKKAPRTKTKPLLAVIMSSHWAIRNLLFTGGLREIAEDFEILAWAPEKLIPSLQHVASQLEMTVEWRPLQKRQFSKLHALAYQVQKGLLLEKHRVATELLLQRRTGRRTRLQLAIGTVVRGIARTPLAQPSYNAGSKLRYWTTPAAVYARDFDRYQPALVLSTNIIDPGEDPIYYECRKRGVPVVSMVSSWDNLAKGPVHTHYRRVLTWNQVMADSLRTFYPNYQADQLEIIGIPRFDIYHGRLPQEFERGPFLRRFGMDPAKKVVLYATNGGWKNFPNEREVIRHVYEDIIQQDATGTNQLLIRPHPHENIEDYNQFTSLPRVGICVEPTSSRAAALHGDVLPPADALWELTACLRHSAVCVNAASTISLDAVACDIPVVSVGYDGDHQLPHHDSILAAYEFTHQPPFLKYGATEICRSRAQLRETILDALRYPDRLSSNRRAVAAEFLNCDGRAVRRLRTALCKSV